MLEAPDCIVQVGFVLVLHPLQGWEVTEGKSSYLLAERAERKQYKAR